MQLKLHTYECFSNFLTGVVSFENYKEFLLYTYNSIVAEGRLEEIIKTVREQPKGPAFNFDGNTQEGKWFHFKL